MFVRIGSRLVSEGGRSSSPPLLLLGSRRGKVAPLWGEHRRTGMLRVPARGLHAHHCAQATMLQLHSAALGCARGGDPVRALALSPVWCHAWSARACQRAATHRGGRPSRQKRTPRCIAGTGSKHPQNAEAARHDCAAGKRKHLILSRAKTISHMSKFSEGAALADLTATPLQDLATAAPRGVRLGVWLKACY